MHGVVANGNEYMMANSLIELPIAVNKLVKIALARVLGGRTNSQGEGAMPLQQPACGCGHELKNE